MCVCRKLEFPFRRDVVKRVAATLIPSAKGDRRLLGREMNDWQGEKGGKEEDGEKE